MFFVSFLDSNMFVYDIMTCWDKNACFRGKKCLFLGLAMAANFGLGRGCHFWAFLGIFLGFRQYFSCSWKEHFFHP
jgi:hypothetical protein